MAFIAVYITHKDRAEAKRIVSHLLKRRLIACANTFPIESAYWWKGKIKKTKEIVTIVKTRKSDWKRLKDEVEKIHPYEIPCIMRLEASANRAYEEWINKETC
jgi:periplasmic divalent cation tolerance protein